MGDDLAVNEVLKRCRKRPTDEDAWREFIRRYDSSIRAFVTKNFQRRASQEPERRGQFTQDQVEDLVQTVYVRLIVRGSQAFKQFSGKYKNSIYQYLGIISLNVVRDYFREAKALKRPMVSCSLDGPTGEQVCLDSPVGDIDGGFRRGSCYSPTREDIDSALKKSVGRRHGNRDEMIFKLHYYEGLTLDEIRIVLGLNITVEGIASLLNRIKERLRERLAGTKNATD